MDEEELRYRIWVCSVSDDVGWVNNPYHPDDYKLAAERYKLFCENPEVRLAKLILVLYHNNGDTEVIMLKRYERK